MTTKSEQLDPWYEWLVHLRHADDPLEQDFVRKETERYAHRVLEGAQLTPGMTLMDVGAGDGLVAFLAARRIGPSLKVILTDISRQLLTHAKEIATIQGVDGQCNFLECNAEEMAGISDASVDAVTTRSVLAYVENKESAFREFHRVLKKGGRLSIAEPIMMDDARTTCALKAALLSAETEEIDYFLSLMHRWKSSQFPDTAEKTALCPMTNFTERDLVGYAQVSGFSDIHMELHIDVRPIQISSWNVFISSTPHPLAPSLKQIMHEQFSAKERAMFESIIRPIIESDGLLADERMTYLTATKK